MRSLHRILTLLGTPGPDGQPLSVRTIATQCGVGLATVVKYQRLAAAHRIPLPPPPDVTDEQLRALFFPPRRPPTPPVTRPEPDWAHVHRELKRPHVTRRLLWQEYKAQHSDGYQYTQYCARYDAWKATLDVCLRQEYKAGEKVLVDFSGTTVPITDPKTGVVTQAQLFVGVLGASNRVYCEVTWTQNLQDWVMAHVRMFEYFQGASAAVVHDNLRAGTSKACRYEPVTNPTYLEMLEHYSSVSLPTRVRSPRDKAKIENEVLHAARRIQAALRNRVFYSLPEAQAAYREQLELLNAAPFQKLPGSRNSRFAELDQPHLKPLPAERYQYAIWKFGLTVARDCHCQIDRRFYSAPYRLRGQLVDAKITDTMVYLYQDRTCVATHVRATHLGSYRTQAVHLPPKHRRHLETTPATLIDRGKRIGPNVGQLIIELYAQRAHPELAYRAALGVLRLADKYPPERVDRAARRALTHSAPSYRALKHILQHALDTMEASLDGSEATAAPRPAAAAAQRRHAHVRGKDSFR